MPLDQRRHGFRNRQLQNLLIRAGCIIIRDVARPAVDVDDVDCRPLIERLVGGLAELVHFGAELEQLLGAGTDVFQGAHFLGAALQLPFEAVHVVA